MSAGEPLQPTRKSLRGFISVSRQIMHLANRGSPRGEFLRETLSLLLQFSGCDAVELRLRGNVEYRCRAVGRPKYSFVFEQLSAVGPNSGSDPAEGRGSLGLRQVVLDELDVEVDRAAPCFTTHGSFWTGDVAKTLAGDSAEGDVRLVVDSDTASLALIPFAVDVANFGVLRLECARRSAFAVDMMEGYEAIAETLGLAIAQRRTQRALQERVKELSCLYSIARVLEDSTAGVDEAMDRILKLLPPAWQFPDIAVARIMLDGNTYTMGRFEAARTRQVAKIFASTKHRGAVEVGYVDDVTDAANGPFLQEEEHLIAGVAREIGEFLERREAEAEQLKLEAQLRHADRLATIGQLAAGVAHEINEPLGSILGFAQLAQKSGELPESTAGDLNRIVAACLQAREIVTKLKLFARQAPIQKALISAALVVDEALALVETRCANQGIEIVRRVETAHCEILADQVQLKQVVVNLVVNSIQAMAGGGRLTVVISRDDSTAVIEVEDTGAGMTEDAMDQIFNPFFTTKDVGQGTGLGLCVVHGIVAAHGGTVGVESEVGKGSKFTVRLPFEAQPGSEVNHERGHE
jgi:signal transduction histidine kinase